MNEKTVCSECGAVLTEGHTHSFDGQIFCEDCFNRCTTTCDNCGDRIWRDNAEGDSNYVLCHTDIMAINEKYYEPVEGEV